MESITQPQERKKVAITHASAKERTKINEVNQSASGDLSKLEADIS